MRIFLPFFLITLFFFACSSTQPHRKPSPVSENPAKSAVEQQLELAASYVPMGKSAEQLRDTLGAEYYFGQAMDIATDLRENSAEKIDSLSERKLESISLEYAKFLARLNGIESDSLGAADVMNALSALNDSLDTEIADSAVVKIPDVIGGSKELAIPLVVNQKVEKAIKYFRSKGRRVFTRWLQRAGRYRNLVSRILQEEGVPPELLYLAMIESGFNPGARSYARAVGMWQFIYSTGRAYGLHRSWWYDERQDPEKATRAAAKHLKDLYKRFNNWYLAIAGYNFSPRKIEYRIRRYKVDEFWKLPRLPRQTRNYVPTFIAAALIAQNPQKYGFFVEPEPPVEYDTVTVHECVDLNVVANCVGSDFKTIKKLNPALLRFCTPPDKDSWVLNIPKGTREKFLAEYAKVPDKEKLTWVRHRIRSGETLSTIARRYGVSMREIKRFNKIRGTLIRAGHSLVIPVPQNKKYATRLARRSTYRRPTNRRKAVTNVPGRTKQVHVVQRGETLWEIATRYGVTLTQIRKWNGLSYYSRIIRPGEKLNIWLPKRNTFAVAEKPSQQKSDSPPQKTENSAGGRTIKYIVRHGDTLWDIAARHGVSIRDIKRWNKRRSNLIRPGDELIIRKN